MKSLVVIILVTIILALIFPVTLTAQVQVHPVAGFSLGGMPNAYLSPIVTGYGGVELEAEHFYSRSTLAGSWARKIDTRDGKEMIGESAVYFGYQHLLFGSGFDYAHQYTSVYAKSAIHPEIGYVIKYPTAIFITRFLLPGNDHVNDLYGPKMTLIVPVSKHLRLVGTLGFYNFHASNVSHGPRLWDASADGGVEYRF